MNNEWLGEFDGTNINLPEGASTRTKLHEQGHKTLRGKAADLVLAHMREKDIPVTIQSTIDFMRLI